MFDIRAKDTNLMGAHYPVFQVLQLELSLEFYLENNNKTLHNPY